MLYWYFFELKTENMGLRSAGKIFAFSREEAWLW